MQFRVAKELIGRINDQELKGIADQAKQMGGQADIMIHNIIRVNECPTKKVPNLRPRAWYDTGIDWSVVKTNIYSDNPEAAQQIISVAKGSTKTLTSSVTKRTKKSIDWNGAVPTSASNKLCASIKDEVSKTYSITETWKGPPESSSAVSRVYYYTGYRDYGNFTIYGTARPSGQEYKYTGSYIEPTYYHEWSRDIR